MPAKYTPEQQVEAFWSRVDKSAGPAGCWPWRGYLSTNGYGHVKHGRTVTGAHRVALILSGDGRPPEAMVCHSCDNRSCCNPAHLFAGTQADNMADMAAKGRGPVGDRNGSRRHPARLPRGSGHKRAKLTEVDIPLIRAAADAGESQSSIASRYGVTQTCISHITRRATWAHIPEGADHDDD